MTEVTAADIHDRSIVVVAHADIVASDVDWRRESGERRVIERRHLPTLKAGGVTVVCDHLGGDAHYGYLPSTRFDTDSLQRYIRALDHFLTDVEESDDVVVATRVDDIHRAKQQEKVAFVICMEGGSPLGGELSHLRMFHRLGLRSLGLTHDRRNEIADGIRERSGGGLTHFGVSVVEACNDLGIVIDVSHLSDRGVQDVIEISRKPIVASHSNSRALCPVPRNLTDDLIRKIAEKGGVIGFHALGRLISRNAKPTMNDLMAHIMHVIDVGGVDSIGIGPDVMENWDRTIVSEVSKRSRVIHGIPTLSAPYRYPDEFDSNAKLPAITEKLLGAALKESDVQKFLGGNFLRVFSDVWS